MHRHHLIPRHMGGNNSEENLTPPISIELHAEFHRLLWLDFGKVEDFIAWKALSGRIKSEEARLAVAIHYLKQPRRPETKEKLSRALRAAWADPVTGARLRAVKRNDPKPKISAIMLIAWQDPTRRVELLASLEKARSSQRPGSAIKAMQIALEAGWNDPETRSRWSASRRNIKKPGTSAALSERNKTPCLFLGVKYESKQTLQRACGFSDRKYYRLLRSGDIARLGQGTPTARYQPETRF